VKKLPEKEYISLEDIFGSKIKVRILKALVEKSLISLTELRKRSKANYKVLKMYLQKLQKAGLLNELTYDRVKLYSLNRRNPKARALEDFFKKWES